MATLLHSTRSSRCCLMRCALYWTIFQDVQCSLNFHRNQRIMKLVISIFSLMLSLSSEQSRRKHIISWLPPSLLLLVADFTIQGAWVDRGDEEWEAGNANFFVPLSWKCHTSPSYQETVERNNFSSNSLDESPFATRLLSRAFWNISSLVKIFERFSCIQRWIVAFW